MMLNDDSHRDALDSQLQGKLEQLNAKSIWCKRLVWLAAITTIFLLLSILAAYFATRIFVHKLEDLPFGGNAPVILDNEDVEIIAQRIRYHDDELGENPKVIELHQGDPLGFSDGGAWIIFGEGSLPYLVRVKILNNRLGANTVELYRITAPWIPHRFVAWMILRSGSVVFVAFLIGFCGLLMISMSRECLRNTKEEEANLQNIIELKRLRDIVSKDIQVAWEIFEWNRRQLGEYYDINRRQNNRIIILGVFVILVGVAVVVYSIFLILRSNNLNGINSEIVTAILAAITALMTNVMAAIYLNVYSKVAESFESFHSRLVGTHHFFIRNLIATTIEDDELRSQTMSKVALYSLNKMLEEPDSP